MSTSDWNSSARVGPVLVALVVMLSSAVHGVAQHPVAEDSGTAPSAEGAGLEFALLFGLGGAGLGALIGR